MNWLFKEEPTHYSYDDLVRDGQTSWTGVRNPVAQKHLRSVKKGDRILIGKYAGTEIKIDDEEHLILREDEVLAVVEK